MKPIDYLVNCTKAHLSNIGRENETIDKNFIITGPNCLIESLIGVTLVIDLQEKINDNFNVDLDILDIINEFDNKDITLDIISEIIKSKL